MSLRLKIEYEPIHYFLEELMGACFTLIARISGKAFSCNALRGKSHYNICINSDLTVSCNCRDRKGLGHIGDLNKETLREVMFGNKAKSFRDKLARGIFPLSHCLTCNELCVADRKNVERELHDCSVPVKGIMVENTVLCNLNCRSCFRKPLYRSRSAKTMTLSDIKKVSSIIKEYGIQSVSFFNLGEPFACPEIGEQIRILKAENPNLKIAISTNGTLLDTDAKREAALLCDEIIFSIDGPDQATVIKYQVGDDFEKAYANLRKLVDLRNSRNHKIPSIEWKYVLFNWNDKKGQVLRAIELAKQAQVDKISFWPTITPVYAISWRYKLCRYFDEIGVPSWKGREIIFSNGE